MKVYVVIEMNTKEWTGMSPEMWTYESVMKPWVASWPKEWEHRIISVMSTEHGRINKHEFNGIGKVVRR